MAAREVRASSLEKRRAWRLLQESGLESAKDPCDREADYATVGAAFVERFKIQMTTR